SRLDKIVARAQQRMDAQGSAMDAGGVEKTIMMPYRKGVLLARPSMLRAQAPN
ncbi:hypothetical protein FRC09_020623, partial [Ceratobasidium sp. 395]